MADRLKQQTREWLRYSATTSNNSKAKEILAYIERLEKSLDMSIACLDNINAMAGFEAYPQLLTMEKVRLYSFYAARKWEV